MERVPLVVANWKMELSHKAAVDAAVTLKRRLTGDRRSAQVVVCPSFPSLADVAAVLKSSEIALGAQNVHWEERGAWTGEVSVLALKPFVRWCIVGHSERRENFGEQDETVVKKMLLLLKHNIVAVVCIGETADELAAGRAADKVSRQARQVFAALALAQLRQIVIAYEPIWAIGIGSVAQPAEAAEMMLLIRKLAVEQFGQEGAELLRTIYGGSVTAGTVEQFVAEPGIDGVLVGGSSVVPLQLVDIIKRVQHVYSGQ